MRRKVRVMTPEECKEYQDWYKKNNVKIKKNEKN